MTPVNFIFCPLKGFPYSVVSHHRIADSQTPRIGDKELLERLGNEFHKLIVRSI